MDFFQRQDNARRKTKWLIGYFVLATALTILAVYAVFAVVSVSQSHSKRYAALGHDSLWNPKLFLWVTAGTLLVVIAGSLYKIAELSQGGALVASSLGGQPLDINATTVEEKKLRNVVEEMAIASGVPVPQIYVLPEEEGINAFAAGFSTSDAVIGVTRGAMQTLTRDELQGVIGHEFSHVLNGDMRLNMRLMGGINGILCIALLGHALLRAGSYSGSRSRKDDSRGAIMGIGLGLLIIGGIGMFFGRLIKSAISRQREFLADASAVQFTRNPAGLAGALKKIGGSAQGSRLEASHAEEMSHLFFGNALSESWANALATHPPLEQRIRALDPGWDGKFPVVQVVREVEVRAPVNAAPPRMQPPFIPAPSLGNLIGGVPALASSEVMVNIGSPTPQQVSYAGELRAAIPEQLRASARQAMGACTMVYSLLLSDKETDRSVQLAGFASANDAGLSQETVRMYPLIAGLDRRLKLPLVNLCLPGLRQLSKTQYERFILNMRLLIESDRTIDLFEYMLQKTVSHHLEPLFTPARKSIIQYYVLKPLEEDAVVLLSALARHGSENAEQISKAFRSGMEQLKVSSPGLSLLDADRCNLSQIDAALNRIAQAAPMVKKTVINACACTVAADGVVEMNEAEMLRAIADSLDCPIPPFVQNV
ncbi:MAG: htpX 1 [Verrucomicrobiales bacterium]|nr:htpX 1 [Verrucomicrobiales bacterium]